jgi:ABC-type Zn uptake system ZnuABC Zn-binding protein ZnuA
VSLPRALRLFLLPVLIFGLIAAACGDDDTDSGDTGNDATATSDAGTDASPSATDGDEASADTVLVVTTVSPIRNIIENVGGDRVQVVGLVPEGTNSHTFEPPPSAAKQIAEADLIVINGLHLEEPTLEMAEANKRDDAEIVQLGNETVSPDEYVYDFSFPKDGGNPNPHLWTAPNMAIEYAEHVRDALSEVDPDAADYYAANTDRYIEQLNGLDAAIKDTVATIPEKNRKLLTYHGSFPYFGPRYGFEIIGAIQPSDVSEPSPREVADIIEQIKEEQVPAIFGSEVFPSDVLDQIADEAGAVQVSTLSDDDLPGDPGDPDNTLVAMMVENVRAMADALGGDPSLMDDVPVENTWEPYPNET